MWVYDGEEWTQEGGEQRTQTEAPRPRWADEFVPELQVIEIVHVPNTVVIPPFPSTQP